MLVKAPGTLFKGPHDRNRKDGSGMYRIQSIIIEGSEYEFFGDIDRDVTAALNGDRAKLDTGEGVDVTATLEVYARGGRPGVDLVAVEPRTAEKAKP